MIVIKDFIENFPTGFDAENKTPWEITASIVASIENIIAQLDDEFVINESIAIHKTAVIETGVIMKGQMIIGKNCFIGANAYLRGGVYLSEKVSIGPGCEIKSSILCSNSASAHFNFMGDSIVGSNVNFEAGAIVANHYNEREDKLITVLCSNQLMATGVKKFGSLIGDGSRIGANAVLSPGTILPKKSIVQRLELVKQVN